MEKLDALYDDAALGCEKSNSSSSSSSSSSSRGAKRKLCEDPVPAAKVASKVTGAGKHSTGKPLGESYLQRGTKMGSSGRRSSPGSFGVIFVHV